MPGLLDIADLPRTVTIQGVDLQVRGLDALDLANLIGRFDEVRALLSGKDLEITPERLLEMVPEAIGAILAMGTGDGGNPAAEERAHKLNAGDQLELLAAIIELTMPQGVGPFMVTVNRLVKAVGGATSGAALGNQAAGNLPKESSNS